METLTKKGLDGTQLKTIALVLMVLDHIHYFFAFTGVIPEAAKPIRSISLECSASSASLKKRHRLR